MEMIVLAQRSDTFTSWPRLHPPSKRMSDRKPELFFGGVAPVGTPLDFAFKTLKNALDAHDYDVEPVKLSEQARLLTLATPETEGGDEYARISALMDRGNEA